MIMYMSSCSWRSASDTLRTGMHTLVRVKFTKRNIKMFSRSMREQCHIQQFWRLYATIVVSRNILKKKLPLEMETLEISQRLLEILEMFLLLLNVSLFYPKSQGAQTQIANDYHTRNGILFGRDFLWKSSPKISMHGYKKDLCSSRSF